MQASKITAKTIRTITQAEGEAIAQKFFDEMAAAVSRVRVVQTETRKGGFKVRGSLNDYDRMGMYFTSRASQVIARKSAVVG